MLKQYVYLEVAGAVEAKPMTKAEYCDYRGRQLSSFETGYDEGYFVKMNIRGSENCVVWSPKGSFESRFKIAENLSFGLAIEALKNGKKAYRIRWGVDTWLTLIGSDYYVLKDGSLPPDGPILSHWIGIKTEDNKFTPWAPSQDDMLAEDYFLVE